MSNQLLILITISETSLKGIEINPKEIIELVVRVVSRTTEKVKLEYHAFVKPNVKPKLTPHCVRTTDINQDSVSNAPEFKGALEKLMQWLDQQNLSKTPFLTVFLDRVTEIVMERHLQSFNIARPMFLAESLCIEVEAFSLYNSMVAGPLSVKGKERMENLEAIVKDPKLDKLLSNAKFAKFPSSNQLEEGYTQKESQSTKNLPSLEQEFDFLLVLDFEATCDDNRDFKPQEIIEFPSVLLDMSGPKWKVVSSIENFVRPVKRPELTPFCMKLTTIKQEDVDKAEPFEPVLKKYMEWVDKSVGKKRVLTATCGDWDLMTMLPNQMKLCENIKDYPDYLKKWVNLKGAFFQATGNEILRDPKLGGDIAQVMRGFDLKSEGTLHRGIDDVKNLARAAIEMGKLIRFKETASLISKK